MTPRWPTSSLAALARVAARRITPQGTQADASTSLAAQSSEAFTQWLVGLAINGYGPLDSAAKLARGYNDAPQYRTLDARIDALVAAESRRSFATGFITSLPVPVAFGAMLPAALIAAWIIQARMVAAMALLADAEPDAAWVRTTVLMALDDAKTPAALRDAGMAPGQWAAIGMAGHLTQPLAQKMWRRATDALVQRATRRGWTRLGRAVPLVGAVFAGGLDAYGCRQVAARARALIVPSPPASA